MSGDVDGFGEFLPYLIYAYKVMQSNEDLPLGDIEEMFVRREGLLYILREPYDHKEIGTLLFEELCGII
jgi:hypothetical protein